MGLSLLVRVHLRRRSRLGRFVSNIFYGDGKVVDSDKDGGDGGDGGGLPALLGFT